MRRLLSVIAVVSGVLTACGGGGGTTSADAANFARATEPRQNDPTAAVASQGLRPVPPPGPTAAPAATSPAIGVPPRPSSTTEPGGGADAKTDAAPPARIAARHVLIQYMGSSRASSSVVRTRDQAAALAQEVLRRARAGEDLARLAVEFSDEPGAGGRGGSLGRFGKGSMVPAFEEAAFKLKVGEVSDVVETPFGFHVILRTE